MFKWATILPYRRTNGLDPQTITISTVLIRISVSFNWKQSGVLSSEIVPLELTIEY
jgi:hypothetical protein